MHGLIFVLVAAAHAAAGDMHDPYRAEELALLKNTPQVHRSSNSLSIDTRSGQPIVFKDNPAEDESFSKYFLEAKFALPTRSDYLVRLTTYEKNFHLLINGLDGRKLQLEALPELSPDKKHYLVRTFDVDAGYYGNSIEIYRVSDFSLAYSIGWPNTDPANGLTGPEKASWASPAKVIFTEATHKRDESWVRIERTIENKGGDWIGPPKPEGNGW